MDIFQTNDVYGEFFQETIIIDEESDGMEYYTMEDALKRLSELKGEPVKNWSESGAGFCLGLPAPVTGPGPDFLNKLQKLGGWSPMA